MAKKDKHTEGQHLIVHMKRIGYDVKAKQVGESELAGTQMLTLEILEVTGSSPYKVGETMEVSTNELKYHFHYYSNNY